MDGGIAILQETTPIWIEVLSARIKAITQNNFVLIWPVPLRGQVNQNQASKMPCTA